MNDLSNSINVVPALIGTMSVIGGTAVGAPINCLGFQGLLGIATVGGLQGSTGSTVNVAIKWQESTSPTGTGALWTDITNEAVSQGSFAFSTITIGDNVAGGTTTGTWIAYESVKKYCRLSDGNRKQWVRPHATLSGTVGLGPKIAVIALMEKPVDSYYVSEAVVVASGNVELTRLQ